MKTLALTSLFLVTLLSFSFSQNTFPSTGNVGIGTSSPGQLFTIQNDAAAVHLQAATSPTGYYTDIVNSYNTNYPFYINVNNSGRFGFKKLGLVTPTDFCSAFISGYYGIAFATFATDPGTANVRLAISQNGNVGIGTVAPASLFAVQLASAVNGKIMTLSRSAGAYGYSFGIDATSNFQLLDNDGTTVRLNVAPTTGYVSIGTTDSKGYMFAVNGSAIATSMVVKLNANWPDYVFKKDYVLPALSEVKIYVDKNRRLPDMPSEEQIAKEGLNLGEMNKLLVKKVEELTLYAIEQDKKEKGMEAMLIEQQKTNKAQEERIAKLESELEILIKTLKKN